MMITFVGVYRGHMSLPQGKHIAVSSILIEAFGDIEHFSWGEKKSSNEERTVD